MICTADINIEDIDRIKKITGEARLDAQKAVFRDNLHTSITQIFNNEMKPLQSWGCELITIMPQQTENVHGSWRENQSYDMVVSEELRKMPDGSSFFPFHDRVLDILLICPGTKGKLFKNKNVILVDGNFENCSNLHRYCSCANIKYFGIPVFFLTNVQRSFKFCS